MYQKENETTAKLGDHYYLLICIVELDHENLCRFIVFWAACRRLNYHSFVKNIVTQSFHFFISVLHLNCCLQEIRTLRTMLEIAYTSFIHA